MDEPARRPASAAELFRVFNRLALQGFGGVLPVAQRELVDRQRWLTREEFVHRLSAAQVLPGPNVVNVALMIGAQFFGWRGALAALAGLVVVPLVIVLLLAALYAHWAHHPLVAGMLRGMGAVAAGLMIATGLKMLPALKRNALGLVACAVLAALAFAAVGGLRWPLLWVVLAIGGAGFVLGWRRHAP
jgi:chromate transporter